MEGTEQTYTYVTTLDAALDARSLYRSRMASIDRVVDVVAVVVGAAFVVSGYPIGSILLIAGAAALVFGRRLRRWILGRRGRSMFGHQTTVRVDPQAIHITNDLGASTIPWTSMTQVRSDARTVIFLRDRLLVFYMPAAAFGSAAEQTTFVDSARTRIAAARQGDGHSTGG